MRTSRMARGRYRLPQMRGSHTEGLILPRRVPSWEIDTTWGLVRPIEALSPKILQRLSGRSNIFASRKSRYSSGSSSCCLTDISRMSSARSGDGLLIGPVGGGEGVKYVTDGHDLRLDGYFI